MSKCQLCPNNHDIRKCELVNGSHLDVCGPCRRRHDALISMVPMSDEEAEAGRDPYETPEEGQAVPEGAPVELAGPVRVAHLPACEHGDACRSPDGACYVCDPPF